MLPIGSTPCSTAFSASGRRRRRQCLLAGSRIAACLAHFRLAAAVEVRDAVSTDFLADMKRKNEADSDHRHIMTPEFREFCVATREHVICCFVFLAFFICSYVAVRHASTHKQSTDVATSGRERVQRRGKSRRHTRYLVTPYSTTFRARQITLIISAVGLAAAGMLSVLLVLTVALSNIMDHGDPKSIAAWRTWLLPPTLLVPGEALSTDSLRVSSPSSSASWIGPQGAHDFPPVLRRLWFYQSSISVFSVAFLLPVGILFENSSHRATTLRRLAAAIVRWSAACAIAALLWELVCLKVASLRSLGLYRPLSPNAATIRYSVYYAMCVAGALPTVLLIVPRGTWALFGWLKCCIGQKSRVAHMAALRHTRLVSEQALIQKRLHATIKSWRWEHAQDSEEFGAVESHSSADEQPLPTPPRDARKKRAAGLPPPHPELGLQSGKPRLRAGSRLASSAGARISSAATRGSSIPRSFRNDEPEGWLGGSVPSLHKQPTHLHASSSTGSLIQYHSDGTELSDDGSDGFYMVRAVRGAHRKRRREREREMQRLSRQIKRYHAQLLFIREDLAKLEDSGVLLSPAKDSDPHGSTAPKHGAEWRLLATMASNAPSVVLSAAAGLCWLLVVLQVVRGALSAIFVGEPDLTHNFTYFIPALPTPQQGALLPAAPQIIGGAPIDTHVHALPPLPFLDWDQLSVPSLVTGCQVVSGVLLFVVVMFGLLSFGTSFEDSVHPMRFLLASYSVDLLRARQWHWLPRVLLTRDVLDAISPISSHPAFASVDPPTKLVGSTSCIYFSSSADLTSYYRDLQRKSAASVSAPNTLLPAGILPDAFFQAKTWGRRVFLLWNRSTKPISGKHLLAYVWIVCALATTWPSVLRTAGLISERAYLLPIASLVQPLWMKYEIDEELAVHPVHAPECQTQKSGSMDPLGTADRTSAGTDSPAPAGVTFSSGNNTVDSSGGPKGGLMSASFSGNGYPMRISATADSEGSGTILNSSDEPHVPASVAAEQPSSMVSNRTALPARTISRRVLLQSLSLESPQRLLVRWVLGFTKAHSSRTAAVLGYAIWWFFPDLIVPLSPTTVDFQLGYLPQISTTAAPPAAYLDLRLHSEWYGMLRRLSRNSIWLPQADDGTPLMIQPPPPPPLAASDELHRQKHADERSKWEHVAGFASLVCSLVLAGAKAAGLYLGTLLHALAERVLSLASLCIGALAKHFAPYVESTFLGTALESITDSASQFACACVNAATAFWELVLHPLYCQTRSVADGVLHYTSSAISMIVATDLRTSGSGLHDNATKAADSGIGVAGTVPAVFISEYWAAAVAMGGPATQRLRLDLWPHLVADTDSARGHPYYDAGSSQPLPKRADDLISPSSASATPPAASSQVSDHSMRWYPADAATPHSLSLTSPEPHVDPTSVQQTRDTKQSEVKYDGVRPVREAWSTLDWLLALYRTVLGFLVCRAVISPSRQSRALAL
ncbi:hypothetical protein GQ54DRAFT_199923 [Martensiomyces pterosporus]|nr:hypothetical protein GQ54DRAFT_199923 [Martensiomyces pterosporus]